MNFELKKTHTQLGRVNSTCESKNYELERAHIENDKINKKLAKLLTENDVTKTRLAELQNILVNKEMTEQNQKK